jgi:hypothetical protein
MTQYQQVLEAMMKIGGSGTLDDICNAIDGLDQWGARNPRASVSRYLSMGQEIRKEGNIWIYDVNMNNEELLY